MTTAFVWHERYAWHDPGNASQSRWVQPWPAMDTAESKRRLRNLVEASGLLAELLPLAPRPATEDELARFHDRGYIRHVRTLAAAGGGDAGESARFGADGYEVAALAAGGCLVAVDAVVEGRADSAYALVRPCGHHAERDRGRGFCVFGNVALAAMHARARHGVGRVAVVDWDVHHGNGTQQAFYDSPEVLTVSLHQDRCYPVDSGGVEERGRGAGEGFNLNVPLPPGSGHGAWLAAVERVVLPALERFRPELLLVACGYDAAVSDPLGRMLCHSDTYRAMTARVLEAADRLCDGRLVFCQEGGYSATYAPFCGIAVLETLSDVRTPVEDPLLGWYRRLGGQALAPHQAAAIDAAAERPPRAA